MNLSVDISEDCLYCDRSRLFDKNINVLVFEHDQYSLHVLKQTQFDLIKPESPRQSIHLIKIFQSSAEEKIFDIAFKIIPATMNKILKKNEFEPLRFHADNGAISCGREISIKPGREDGRV